MKMLTKTDRRASALVIAMLVVILIASFVGVAMYLTTGTLRQAGSSRDYSGLRSATEGALDFAYGVWAKTVNNYSAPATQAQLNAAFATVPAFNGYGYAPAAENGPLKISPVDSYGAPSASPSYTLINLPNYPGWTGKNYSYLASVRLTGTTNGGRTIKYGAKRSINYSVVPLFQATAFFEDDLELYKTAPMTIGGLVHTNGTAYVSSSSTSNPSLTFTGNLSYAGQYVSDTAPPLAYLWSGYSPNSAFPPEYPNGADTSVNQVDRMEPLGTDPASVLHPPKNEDGTLTGDNNPNDDSMRELIEPPVNTGAYPDPPQIADRRLYNKAGIRIHIAVTTVIKNGKTTTVYTPTVTTQNGTSLTNAQVNSINAALKQQTIYDRREGQNVDLTTLDLAAVRSTLNAAAGFNNIIYIDQTDANGNIATNNPQGIRLDNGNKLPDNGLTVASQNPVYIQGDYNTENQKTRGSAAVFADAVTILSNSWNDSHSSDSLSYRRASNTTVNTAIVAGFVPSGWTNFNSVPAYGYSGGLNNFPRFLEDWTNKTFTYTGSMIELFNSQIAIGEWDTGSIYVPPNRNWNFDSNFVANPPPGSLDAVTISRGSLARF